MNTSSELDSPGRRAQLTPAPGARLAHLRRLRGWSQRTLASHAGLSPSTVSRIESGRRTVRTWTVANALAQALGCSIDDLLDAPAAAVTDADAGNPAPAVRRALINTELRVGSPMSFRSWAYLQTLAGLVADRRANCAYRSASQVLPEAIEQAHAALAVDRPRALRAVAQVCLDTSAVALGRGDTAVAWIAGARAVAAAMEICDPALRGAGELTRARIARRAQAPARCLAIAERYLSVAPQVPGTAAVRGLMHLIAGLTASDDVTRPDRTVEGHLAVAERLARRADGDPPSGLDFNEEMVWQVRLRIALNRADVTAAATAVRRIDPDRLGTVGCRAAHLVDLARMQLLLGHHRPALRLVGEALELAGEHVASAPAAQALLADLLASRLDDSDGRLLRSIYRRAQTLVGDRQM